MHGSNQSDNIKMQSQLNESNQTVHSQTGSADEYKFRKHEKFVEIHYKFVPGKRKDSQVLFVLGENQMYHRNTQCKIGRAYVCCEKNCSARVYMYDSRCFKFMQSSHNHLQGEGDTDDLCVRLAIIDEMKRQVIEQKGLSVKEVYEYVMAGLVVLQFVLSRLFGMSKTLLRFFLYCLYGFFHY